MMMKIVGAEEQDRNDMIIIIDVSFNVDVTYDSQ